MCILLKQITCTHPELLLINPPLLPMYNNFRQLLSLGQEEEQLTEDQIDNHPLMIEIRKDLIEATT